MLKSALKFLKPERAYVVPAFQSPLKDPAQAGGEERLKLTGLALKELNKRERAKVSLSSFELDRGRMTYTYETLRYFARRHPDAKLHFLLGSDTALHFRKWKRTSEIRSLCRFTIARRPRVLLSKSGLGLPRYDFLPGIFPDISSTDVRARLLIGEVLSAWIPKGVFHRIRSRRLYGLDIHRRLQKSLPADRYKHTLSTASMAIELASRHGIDIEKAALAGLLHDCGRKVPVAEMYRFVLDNHLRVPLASEIAKHQPLLFHAHISEHIAKTEFGIEDPAVLSAIRKHTLGDLTMSPLDRVVYTADACSHDRDFSEAALIRRKAFKNLQDGFRETLRTKLVYILRLERWFHSSGIGLWNKTIEKR